MPRADENYTFYTIPLPRPYRRLSRRRRLAIELSVGLLLILLLGIAASVQMPGWLLTAGWAFLVVYWIFWIVLYLKRWGQQQLRRR